MTGPSDVVPLWVDSPPADLEAYHSLRVLAASELTPEIDPPGSVVDARSDIDPTLSADRHGFLALDDTGDPLGYAVVWCGLTNNRHLIDSEVYVAPQRRRSGVGTALVTAIVEHAEADDRTTVGSGAPVGSTGSAYARRLGATVGLVERRSTLDVSRLDWADIGTLAAAASPGYEIVRWNGRCPEELLDGYVAVNDAMNTAPRGELDIHDHRWTVAEVRANEEHRARAGAHGYTVAARSLDNGELAGFTEVVVPPSRAGTGFQEDTAVIPAHRGHGLGLLMKSTMLTWLHDVEPQLRVIQTWNAASNEHMLRVNIRLGFVGRDNWELTEAPVATLREHLRE